MEHNKPDQAQTEQKEPKPAETSPNTKINAEKGRPTLYTNRIKAKLNTERLQEFNLWAKVNAYCPYCFSGFPILWRGESTTQSKPGTCPHCSTVATYKIEKIVVHAYADYAQPAFPAGDLLPQVPASTEVRGSKAPSDTSPVQEKTKGTPS